MEAEIQVHSLKLNQESGHSDLVLWGGHLQWWDACIDGGRGKTLEAAMM